MSTLDRDAARPIIRNSMPVAEDEDTILDALEGCVRPAPQQTIDRDALVDIIERQIGVDQQLVGTYVDRILALLRPVDGIVLTREEAAVAIYALRHIGDGTAWRTEKHRALAERLEAAS